MGSKGNYDIVRITGKTRGTQSTDDNTEKFSESTDAMTFIKRHATMLYLLGKETEVPCNRYQIYKPKENGINIVVYRSLN